MFDFLWQNIFFVVKAIELFRTLSNNPENNEKLNLWLPKTSRLGLQHLHASHSH